MWRHEMIRPDIFQINSVSLVAIEFPVTSWYDHDYAVARYDALLDVPSRRSATFISAHKHLIINDENIAAPLQAFYPVTRKFWRVFVTTSKETDFDPVKDPWMSVVFMTLEWSVAHLYCFIRVRYYDYHVLILLQHCTNVLLSWMTVDDL